MFASQVYLKLFLSTLSFTFFTFYWIWSFSFSVFFALFFLIQSLFTFFCSFLFIFTFVSILPSLFPFFRLFLLSFLFVLSFFPFLLSLFLSFVFFQFFLPFLHFSLSFTWEKKKDVATTYPRFIMTATDNYTLLLSLTSQPLTHTCIHLSVLLHAARRWDKLDSTRRRPIC